MQVLALVPVQVLVLLQELGQLVQLVLELLAARSSKRLGQLVQVSCLGERSGYQSHKLHPALVLGQASVLLFIFFLVLFFLFLLTEYSRHKLY